MFFSSAHYICPSIDQGRLKPRGDYTCITPPGLALDLPAKDA